MGRVLVAESAMNVALLNHSLADLGALAEYGHTRQDIANAFGVPIAFLTAESNLANLQASESQHMKLAIRPRLNRRDEKLNEQLVPRFDPTKRLFLASEDPIPGNQDASIKQDDLARPEIRGQKHQRISCRARHGASNGATCPGYPSTGRQATIMLPGRSSSPPISQAQMSHRWNTDRTRMSRRIKHENTKERKHEIGNSIDSPFPIRVHSVFNPWLLCFYFVFSFFRVFVLEMDSEPMSDIVKQLGPEAPVQTNDQGGKQSAIPVRCDLLPARAVLEIAATLAPAAIKYGPDNWRRIARKDHINHALAHIFAHLAADDADDHLKHAACRLLFAMETT